MTGKIFFILFFGIFAQLILAQTETKTDTFKVNLHNSYKINSLSIIPFSEKIYINKNLLQNENYLFNYESGSFSFSEKFKINLTDTIVVVYNSVKISLKKDYRRRKLFVDYSETENDSIRVSNTLQKIYSPETIFGSNIEKSGALVRGFTVGTNRDFTLNSGLRLQLSGRLTDEIEIIAALTDENTPIQPEGNTETLEELDKVFIELKHQNAVGTFGDYELNERDGEFSQLTRKLQGLKGEFKYGSNKGYVAIAGSRGKFNSAQFNGMDGNQGPFRLYGANNERAFIIIAGSERVYLDGELMKRGENNDYIIDYSNSEVTFTPKRLITSASRITIDFEYSDQNYRRNFFGTSFNTSFMDNKLKFGVSFFREGDDENSPIDFSFSDSDLKILKNAGNNQIAASRSGVSLAEPDSLGKVVGIYSSVDTLINSNTYTYYKYNPGNPNAIYNVTFSFVGAGNGDYTKESLGKYKFVGPAKGSYLPLVFLPLPERKNAGNFSIKAVPWLGVNLNLELSGSQYDRNTLSDLDESNNYGYAYKLFFQVVPREVEIGKFSLGKIGFSYKDRFIQNQYSPLDRIDAVEFNRYYNTSQAPKSDQILREVDLNILPRKNFSIYTKYGFLKQSENFISNRFFGELKYNQPQIHNLEYKIDFVDSKNNLINTSWNKQNGKIEYDFGFVKPAFDFLYENKEDLLSDSLLVTSLKYVEAIPNLELRPLSFLTLSAGYSYREEFFPLMSELKLQSKSATQRYQVNFIGIKELSSSINFTFRNKDYTEEFKSLGYSNNETVLFLSQNRVNIGDGFIQGDLYYQASTEQSARLEKVFVRVPRGSGSYIYLGDLNNNGIPEENEFQLTSYDGEYIVITVPTDELFPVIDLKTNTRWRINFDRMFDGENFWSRALAAISTETAWRIEENSKEKNAKEIYLFNLNKYLNDSTTIRGSQLFQQDLNLFQNKNDFSIRFRYMQRKNLSQFSSGLEKGYFRERGIRLRLKLISEINNQTEYIIQNDNLISPASTGRAREVTRYDLSTDFSYRPVQNIEFGFKVITGTSSDGFPVVPTEVDLNSIVLRFNFSFENFGRLRIEAERTELISNNSNVVIPYEVTRGNVIGKNYYWRTFLDYKIGSFIQTSLSYDARLLGTSRVIHTMRAEARAYF